MADTKCQYQLHGKYNGLEGYTNDKLTDKKAEALAKSHPRGFDLFKVVPDKLQKERDAQIAKDEKAAADIVAASKAKVKAEKDRVAAQFAGGGRKKRISLRDIQNTNEAKLAKEKKSKPKS